MSSNQTPRVRLSCRIFSVILLLIALALTGGGAYLLTLGGSPYYLLVGLALLASAVLLWNFRAEGALIYGLVFLVTIAWAVWEVGFDGWALMPRILAPAVLGLVLLIPVLRAALFRPRAAWSAPKMLGALAIAVVAGAGLRAGIPPKINVDPMYQTGTTTAQQAGSPGPVPGSGDWPHYGNDLRGTRFSPLTQITPENVSRLKRIWTFRTAMEPSGLEVTPLKIDDTLYICTAGNAVIALDAETGKERWRFDTHANYKVPTPRCRGVGYFRAPDKAGVCAERIITATVDARMFAVDAHTGAPCPDFGTNGEISLLTGMGAVERGYYYVTSAPTVVNGKIVIGGNVSDNQMVGEPSGVIRAFDALTGQLAWAWDMGAPDRLGEPAQGDQYTRATPNAWGPMSADEELGLVYVPLGNPTPDYYGPLRRPFDEEYGSSVVALDVNSGRPRWHFQTAHHDLWDYDIAQQPTLVDFPTAQGLVHAVVVTTKRAEIFVFDRATGAPIFPVEERPAPQHGAAPDEHLAPTQPFSTGMPSFRGADLTERSMWGVSPVDQLYCRIRFRQARYDGPMTPPGLTPSIQFPGYAGGMEWGSAAVDVSRHILVVNTIHVPNYDRLLTRAEANARGLKRMTAETAQLGGFNEGLHPPQEGTPYGGLVGPFMSPLQIPCSQPPYGLLSAVDLSTGKLIWSQRFGTARDIGPLRIPSLLPFTIGVPNIGGGVATQSGLFFIGATQDAYLRAYDTATGQLRWESRLPAGGNATPVTYISPASRREFVVIAAGGSAAVGAPDADYIVAYALPEETK